VDIVKGRPVTFAMGCDPKRDETKMPYGAEQNSISAKRLEFSCSELDTVHDVTLTKPYSLGKFEVSRRRRHPFFCV
jgi:nitrogenase subunit NifH